MCWISEDTTSAILLPISHLPFLVVGRTGRCIFATGSNGAILFVGIWGVFQILYPDDPCPCDSSPVDNLEWHPGGSGLWACPSLISPVLPSPGTWLRSCSDSLDQKILEVVGFTSQEGGRGKRSNLVLDPWAEHCKWINNCLMTWINYLAPITWTAVNL